MNFIVHILTEQLHQSQSPNLVVVVFGSLRLQPGSKSKLYIIYCEVRFAVFCYLVTVQKKDGG